MYCTKCGKDIGDANFCPDCGTPSRANAMNIKQDNYMENNANVGQYEPIANDERYNREPIHREEDQSSFMFAIIAFFFPIVGIVLYIIWKNEFPLKAKSCLKGFLSGIIFNLISAFLIIALATSGMSSMNDDFDTFDYSTFNYVTEEVIK